MTESGLPFAAMILAGGLGTRLRSVVADRPKPMAVVNGTPFIELLICSLADKGVRNFILLTGYMGETIEEHFRGAALDGLTIRCSHETEPLGTGGAVKNAERFASDPTLLVNGDTFFDADVHKLFRFHVEKKAAASLSLVRVEDVSRYGSVTVDAEGVIRGFREKGAGKPGPGWINAGLSLLSRSVIHDLPPGRSFSMERETFPELAGEGRLAGLGQQGAFFDIGTPESYQELKEFVRTKNYQTVNRPLR
jgi:D-glycero-alpha-D-manno-heptose 1-phosphate guanylyltransferase